MMLNHEQRPMTPGYWVEKPLLGRGMVAATAIFLGLLNGAIGVMYTLWSIADTWAVDRSELHGFDPGQLLPHDNAFWLVANLSLALLATVDVLVIVILVRIAPRRLHRVHGRGQRRENHKST